MRSPFSLALPLLLATLGSGLAAQAAAGSAQLRVLDLNGGPLLTFRLTVLGWGQGKPGPVYFRLPTLTDRQFTPRDFQSTSALVDGLPKGPLVFQIHAASHASMLSEPFLVRQDKAEPTITVRLTRGGTLTGTVTGPDGKPVAGALVGTDLPKPQSTVPRLRMGLVQVLPETITATRTDDQGHFRLAQLALGDYLVRVQHPDFCERVLADLKVAVAGTQTLPDAEGHYRSPQRLPSGVWTMLVMGNQGDGASPAQRLQEAQKAQCSVQIQPDQERCEQDFQLPPR